MSQKHVLTSTQAAGVTQQSLAVVFKNDSFITELPREHWDELHQPALEQTPEDED